MTRTNIPQNMKAYNYPNTKHHKNKLLIVATIMLASFLMLVLFACIVYRWVDSLIKNPNTSNETTRIEHGGYIDNRNGTNIEVPVETTIETISMAETDPKPRRESLTAIEPYTYSPKNWGIPYIHRIYNVTDIFGNEYSTAIESEYLTSVGTASATFRLNNEFSRLEFDLAVPDEDRGYEGAAEIYIYNGKDLIFERKVSSDMDTEHIVLPLDNCKDLTIELYSYKSTALYNLSVMMCDPFLYR